MARFIRNTEDKAGLPPGSLVFVGERKMDRPRIRVMDFTPDNLTEMQVEVEELPAFRDNADSTTWINIDGLHDTALMERVRDIFNLPALVMEDVLNTADRPKIEEHGDIVHICLKMLFLDGQGGDEQDGDNTTDKGAAGGFPAVHAEQLSLVLGQGVLLTFQERGGDVFDPVRGRMRAPRARIRQRGADYLTYALMDCVYENYARLLERLGDDIEAQDDLLLDDPGPDALGTIALLKRELAFVAKAVRPAREMALKFPRLESELIREETLPYLRDLRDLAEQTGEALDAYKEILAGQLNVYNSAVANKLSDIMRFLTVFSVIFIPLTFLAGVYGTNFRHIPELEWKYGYWALWAVMLCVAGGMVVYFRKRKWL